MNFPKTVYLKDYTPPDYRVEKIDLRFELGEETTLVHSRMAMVANYDYGSGARELVLDGDELETVSLSLDGRLLQAGEYREERESLTLPSPPERFLLEITTRIHPSANSRLEGLYTSGGNFCTQCEAEGFRRITWYPDRPDNMALFTTRIEADRARYPLLLSNGNLVAQGPLEGGRHYAEWEDPYPKPSYLFALVAGDLACVEDRFVTCSGREVTLRIYVQHGNEGKTGHAMASLKKAMRWDEERYGREYDLDIYMIVAVDDFNMGAMENKGLNLFNSRYVLACSDTATDQDFVAVEGVVAHEYFHNWSGNRVTCRDWFQLSLKEGFTVFRDQCFTQESTSPAVARIGDVNLLRNMQFREDGGPMAHPVRPASYVEINNFYTTTVYEKGAELVRMIRTLLGEERFRQGSDLYFARHDGQAVTTDDFVAAMEDASGVDLSQFKRWYEQAGTPELTVRGEYDAAGRRYTLQVVQRTDVTPGQLEKLPFHIPLAMGLLDAAGREMPLRLEGEERAVGTSRVLSVTEEAQSFVFLDLPSAPVPSLLRDFSAPVRLDFPYSHAELALLMAHDSDPFNRWEAGQRLAVDVMLRGVEEVRQGRDAPLDEALAEAFGQTLNDAGADPWFLSRALTLPEEEYVGEFMEVIDPEALHTVRDGIRRGLAVRYREALLARFLALAGKPFAIDALSMGRRSLRNLALAYLMTLEQAEVWELARRQFDTADNMTDRLAALTLLAHHENPHREEVLELFYQRWRSDALVLDKWFTIRAASPLPNVLDEVRALSRHPDFNPRNPNRLRALVGAFSRNSAHFHDRSGAGYAFLGDWVLEVEGFNPQIAARLAAPFTQWRRFDEARRAAMHAQLERIAARPGLSKDLYEVVVKSLGT